MIVKLRKSCADLWVPLLHPLTWKILCYTFGSNTYIFLLIFVVTFYFRCIFTDLLFVILCTVLCFTAWYALWQSDANFTNYFINYNLVKYSWESVLLTRLVRQCWELTSPGPAAKGQPAESFIFIFLQPTEAWFFLLHYLYSITVRSAAH